MFIQSFHCVEWISNITYSLQKNQNIKYLLNDFNEINSLVNSTKHIDDQKLNLMKQKKKSVYLRPHDRSEHFYDALN
jgi:hypothetical protein